VFTTIIFLVLLVGGLLVSFLLWVLFLRLGARWAKLSGVTTRRALIVLVASMGAQLLTAISLELVESATSLPPRVQTVVDFVVMQVVSAIIIALVLHATWRQALRVWLMTLLSPIFGVMLALLLVRPFVLEAFSASGNSMAPTILSSHFIDICPTCGGLAYGSPPPQDAPHMDRLAICDKFHVHAVTEASSSSTASPNSDKFIAAKYLRPRRWDLVTFRLPSDPKIIYVKRLVGLPGETVVIKDGAISINGQKQDPPTSLNGLTYITEIPHAPPGLQITGAPERPAVLGPDEYFVLGDFSAQSSDSRLWTTGAPGHPPYAVPASYIIGVVTHIYWPPGRWRVLR
jgi:signal peptidase I